MPKRKFEANIKDERTGRLRQLLSALECAEETYDAAAGLTTLSFASRKHPERHVWVDTDYLDSTTLDLEDRNFEGTWDNCVKTIDGLCDEGIVSLVRQWLSGRPLEAIELKTE